MIVVTILLRGNLSLLARSRHKFDELDRQTKAAAEIVEGEVGKGICNNVQDNAFSDQKWVCEILVSMTGWCSK
jgi:hypothetical protein